MPIRYAYGRKPDHYDPRDRRIHVGAAAPLPLSDFFSLIDSPHMPPIYDQGGASSCVGNGTAALYDFTHHKQSLPFLTPSRLAIYFGARELEGDTSDDDGAEIRDGVQTVAKAGAAPESLWPYDISKVRTKPSTAYYAEALKHTAISYARVSQADYYIGYCLEIQGTPIVFGTYVYGSFESAEVAKTGMVPMPGVNESEVGGHCMVIVARDAKRDLYGVRNSWGVDWGQKGYCWFPRPYLLNNALASDFWTITTESV